MRLLPFAAILFTSTTTVFAAAETDYSCYFKCARAAPTARNVTQAETGCVAQQDDAAVFRCICESKTLQGAVNYCMFQTCFELQKSAEHDLAAVGCDVSDEKLNSLLNGGDETGAARRMGASEWAIAGSTVLGAILVLGF